MHKYVKQKDWVFRKQQQQKTSVHWTFSFLLIISNSHLFDLFSTKIIDSLTHRNTVFYSEIHLNKLLKDLYFLKSHTLSGFVCILGISISDLKKKY